MAETENLDIVVDVIGDERAKARLRGLDKYLERIRRRSEALNRMTIMPTVSLKDRVSGQLKNISGDLEYLTKQKWIVTLDINGQVNGTIKQMSRLNKNMTIKSNTVPASGTQNESGVSLGGSFDFNNLFISSIAAAANFLNQLEIPERFKKGFLRGWSKGQGLKDSASKGLILGVRRVKSVFKTPNIESDVVQSFGSKVSSRASAFKKGFSETKSINPLKRIASGANAADATSTGWVKKLAGNTGKVFSKGLGLANIATGALKVYSAKDRVKAGAEVSGDLVGGRIGNIVGAAAGSLLGPAGTVVGGLLGGWVGSSIGKFAGGKLVELKRKFFNSSNSTEVVKSTTKDYPQNKNSILSNATPRPLEVSITGEPTVKVSNLPPTNVTQSISFNVSVNGKDYQTFIDEVTDKVALQLRQIWQNKPSVVGCHG